MKAFFSRLHLGGNKEKEPIVKEKFPPLKPWPPNKDDASSGSPRRRRRLSTRVLPAHGDDQASSSSSTTPTPPSPTPTHPQQPTTSSTNSAEIQKKVAFISPPPTPGPSLDRALPQSPTPQPPPVVSPTKNSVSRFHAAHAKEPRGSTSSSTRTASPTVAKPDMSSHSLRSGSPYSQMSENTSGSRILAAQSWSEVAEDDLVSNLGSRERTRQEVLFEIIQSEERYVQELVKMKDTFIDPLLHPFASTSASPIGSSTPNLDYDFYRSDSPPVESSDHLPPIAARFMSPTPPTPLLDADSMDSDDDDEADDRMGKGYSSPTNKQRQAAKHNHPRSPYRSTVTRTAKSVPFPSGSRSHHSLPAPPPRSQQLASSTQSLGRQSIADQTSQSPSSKKQPATPMLRKSKKSDAPNPFGDSIAPHQLPEDLRICLQVVDSGVLDGHKRLSESLKKRYDDQYPLVRSLADVFVSNADIFHGYATYVLHLERALEQVDSALNNTSTKKPKNQDVAEWNKVCRFLRKLEENASDKGETGLAITLSKPFQRLLKYPLLFQNLLFHTDPSTFEYESTLQMVAEVETIVRSIEDEKIQKEERDKTRDVFARIEGLDKVRQLALPKPSRILVEERQCPLAVSPSKSPTPTAKTVKGRSSLRKLSDVLGSQKKDLWFVVFNDVVLQCQKTGTTSLPMIAATNSRTNSLPELQGKAKYATTGRRGSHTRPRNLYKFIKIETWAIGDVVQPREGVVSMEDVARTRSHLATQPRIIPLPPDREDDEDGGAESDDSDRKSKMSFSYWGADKVTVQKPVLPNKGRLAVSHPRRGGVPSSYARESSANAKFGSRLVSEGGSTATRPASRRTGISSRQGEYSMKSTSTKPEWNANTRGPTPVKRVRNTSQTSAAASVRPAGAGASAVKLASPAPSEDSGVGLYRQMLAKDPSLNNA
ncbi:hypothetical protein CPB85DRAFT_1428379 [Mucidula mucida]|nr:hypothetical protein CPB85DRAFT_1428379 [Mucidula mucida]